MLAVPVRKISRVMGFDARVTDVAQLIAVIERGLPKQAFLSVLAFFPKHGPVSRNRLLGRVVSPSAFKRRKLLTPEEGEKVVRLARLTAFACTDFDKSVCRAGLNVRFWPL